MPAAQISVSVVKLERIASTLQAVELELKLGIGVVLVVGVGVGIGVVNVPNKGHRHCKKALYIQQ